MKVGIFFGPIRMETKIAIQGIQDFFTINSLRNITSKIFRSTNVCRLNFDKKPQGKHLAKGNHGVRDVRYPERCGRSLDITKKRFISE